MSASTPDNSRRPSVNGRSEHHPHGPVTRYRTAPSSAQAPRGAEGDVFDVVGVGFGPSNLALAIAIREHNDVTGSAGTIRARFFERSREFSWHGGMLLPGTTMRVPFLKDLATLRNPLTTFSFVSYLHSKDRLSEFINHKSVFPSRVEFHDYLKWAAERLSDVVTYGADVVAIRPVAGADAVECFEVVTRSVERPGAVSVTRARNVVVATGLVPEVPPGVERSERVWHSADLVPRLASFADPQPRRFVVVGAGQSAAEVADHLHATFRTAEVYSVLSRYGYSLVDDSPFANGIYDPGAVDTFFEAHADAKRMLVDYHANTNYAAVDQDVVEALYRRSYEERVTGRPRLHMVNVSRVTDVHESADGVVAFIRSLATGREATLECDAIVFATGYRTGDIGALLGDWQDVCLRDERGRLRLGRDYRVETVPEVTAGIYVQGASEHLHGLSSTLLSNTAVRAGEILRSLLAAHLPAGAPEVVSHA